jgi:hypothetical protein
MKRVEWTRLIMAVLTVVAVAFLAPAAPLAAKEDLNTDQDSLAKALKKGKATVDFRYRWAQVDDDFVTPGATDFNNDGYASTLRTTLAYQTSRWVGLSGYIQFEDVSNLGAADKHNSTSNGIINRPFIADPKGVELQQAYLRYTLDDVVQATLGRLEFAVDNQRFVGPVGWRQNHQSFDVVKVDLWMIPRTKLMVGYIDQVNRIFGDSKDMSSFIANANIKLGQGTLTPYLYMLDFGQNSGLLAQSSNTFGISWAATAVINENWSIPYRAEYALQKDAGDNPNERDADYSLLEVGGKHKRCWFKGGYELLSGSQGDGQFTTPLATLHKFNGWADRFLVTPLGGIEDIYVAAGGGWAERWSAMGAYHMFGTDSSFVDLGGNTVSNYGSELDASVTYKASWKQTFSFKLALYSADDTSILPTGQDVSKFWLYTTYKF